MLHLGDITLISGYNVPPVDVVIGGSPCQDLSIAGKRAGLAGARSGLFMEQLRIVREMRDADRLRGRTGELIRPRYMVWENVVGAFSSNKGKDFQAVLEETIRLAEPEAPPIPLPKKGKWPLADAYYGDGWALAYRVFDSQFWGVPQRRRRIALVMDFGGQSSPSILFERKGLYGSAAESETAGQAITGGVGRSPGEADTASASGRTIGFMPQAGGNTGLSCLADVAPTLVGSQKAAVLCGAGLADRTAIVLNDQGGQVMDVTVERTGTLRAQEHGHQPIVYVSAGFKAGAGGAARGIGYQVECAPTLSAVNSGSNQVPAVVQVPIVFDARGNGNGKIVPTLTGDHESRITDYTAIVTAVDCRNGMETVEVNGTLQAKPTGGASLNLNNVIRRADEVRRLTPLECERVQGFPDGWTDIGEWRDEAGKIHKSSDTARYTALGNSIALPPWKWVLKRLCALYERDATMASLFDGIGGFPLIWERLNGPGTCLWASEISPFCIAVTQHHFGKM